MNKFSTFKIHKRIYTSHCLNYFHCSSPAKKWKYRHGQQCRWWTARKWKL